MCSSARREWERGELEKMEENYEYFEIKI